MTFTLVPKDEAEGSIMWVKIALATFIGAMEPIFEPYPYVPYDPAVSRQQAFVGEVLISPMTTEPYGCPQPRADRLDILVPDIHLA